MASNVAAEPSALSNAYSVVVNAGTSLGLLRMEANAIGIGQPVTTPAMLTNVWLSLTVVWFSTASEAAQGVAAGPTPGASMKTNIRVASVACIAALAAGLAACSGDPAGSKSTGTAVASPKAGGTAAPFYAELPSNVKSAGVLVFGSQMAAPPAIQIGEDGKTISGSNWDLAQELQRQLGVEVRFQQIGFAGLIPALNAGKIDGIFDVFNDTPERQKSVDMVDYLKTGITILVAADNPHKITSLGDFCGRTAALISGSVGVTLIKTESQKCLSSGKPAVTIKQYPGAPEARLQVQSGKADASVGDSVVLPYLAKTAGGGKIFATVPDPQLFGSALHGIGVAKTNKELQGALMKALSAMIADGSYQRVLDAHDLGCLAVKAPTINGAR